MSIEITANAIKEVKKAIEEQDSEDQILRVGVEGGGCSGFNYILKFVNNEDVDSSSDEELEFDGLKVVVDKKSMVYLEGTSIDFMEDINQRGFKFNNPQASKCCGCGNSFSCG